MDCKKCKYWVDEKCCDMNEYRTPEGDPCCGRRDDAIYFGRPKRKPLHGTLPLTDEERRHISDKYLGYLFSEITIKRHTMHGDIGLFLYSCDREVRIDDLRIILWLAERFNLTGKGV